MTELWIILSLLAVVAGSMLLEYGMHLRHLRTIPTRIHVNGTRGKSSVTRLVAAALREHGIRTIAKTTGTLPRVIMPDGTEYPVYRPSRANILEQVRIVGFAAEHEAEALVIECMALQPRFQSLCELRLVRATHGVITNARPDHLDVMGPTERHVALALLGTTPRNARLFTCEQDYLPEFEAACQDRGSELVIVGHDQAAAVTAAELGGFSYVEHAENIALAVEIVATLGVPRDVAVRGMHRATPDFGVMKDFVLSYFGRRMVFVNGFAANDPESTERLWRMSLERHPDVQKRIIVVNTRADRPDRSLQLGEAMVDWPAADAYVAIGSGTYPLVRTAVNRGLGPSKFVFAEGQTGEQVFERLLGLSGRSALIVGIGNIAGPGGELVNYFAHRAENTL
jgi:poly-gamma-glutamate synthase PgsB/CapB